MAKPKITRLSDPSNPYGGGKKTPTRDRTPAEKLDAIARSKATPERKAPAKASSSEKPDSHYMRLRKEAINRQVERADPTPKRKK